MAVNWQPFELHPEIPEEGLDMPAELRARFGGMNNHLRQLAAESGLPMVVPDRIPSSRRALEASEFARKYGRHELFHRAVFRKFYGEGHDLHSWSVLRAAALEAGLDAKAMEQETSSGEYRSIVNDVSDKAKSLGIHAVPAFVLGQRFAIIGLQPLEVFRQAIARLRAESKP